MRINTQRGFTLIELLVVIAIIGILASVVLASLNNARAKGNEAKISSQISGARVAAELYYSNNNNSYGTTNNSCAAGMFADSASGMSAYALAGNYPGGTVLTCDANDTGYAIMAAWTPPGGSAKYWCVDSTGTSTIGSATAPVITGDSDCDPS